MLETIVSIYIFRYGNQLNSVSELMARSVSSLKFLYFPKWYFFFHSMLVDLDGLDYTVLFKLNDFYV